MATVGVYNICVNQNATFTLSGVYSTTGQTPVPVDLTGCSALLQVRASPESTNVLFEASTDNGKISFPFPTTHGAFLIRFTDVDTYSMNFNSGVYDLMFKMADGTINKIMQGEFIINPSVSAFASTVGNAAAAGNLA
jgi:hypothetical protein